MVKQGQRIQDLVGLIHKLYAPELAEDWDNVGLQVGDPGRPLDRVMVALDPGLEAVEAARDAGAQALVTHHPLLFKPVKRLTPDDAVGKVLWTAVRDDVAIISAHTNLDCAVDGLNSWLAQKMGVEQAIPLQAVAGDYLKLVVFVPVGHEDAVSDALFSAGGGQIGAYDQCSFRSSGKGRFVPGLEPSLISVRLGKEKKPRKFASKRLFPSVNCCVSWKKCKKLIPTKKLLTICCLCKIRSLVQVWAGSVSWHSRRPWASSLPG